jgi:hypothetical protein
MSDTRRFPVRFESFAWMYCQDLILSSCRLSRYRKANDYNIFIGQINKSLHALDNRAKPIAKRTYTT